MNELEQIDRQEMQRSSGVVMPVASPEEMHNAMVLYQRMKEAVLDKDTDYQKVPGNAKPFVKKSGWAKLAIAFGVSSYITGEVYERSADGGVIRARIKVMAEAPNGRRAEGLGICDIGESRFSRNRDKVEHDIPATAETRGRNRAYANLFGHGEVSYEEVQLLGADDGATDADFRPSDDGQGRGYGAPAQPDRRADIPKASPYKPASANQLATASKLARLLGRHFEPTGDETSAEISDIITDLSRQYNERKGGTPVGQRYSPAQIETMPEPAKQEAARARADIADSVAASGGTPSSTAGITSGQKVAITKLAPQVGDIVPENLAEWSFLEAAAYITSLQERLDANKKVTA